MVRLRSGRQTDHGHYDHDFCRTFLDGEYPNLSLFTLMQLQNLKSSLQVHYNTIQYNMRVQIIDNRLKTVTSFLYLDPKILLN